MIFFSPKYIEVKTLDCFSSRDKSSKTQRSKAAFTYECSITSVLLTKKNRYGRERKKSWKLNGLCWGCERDFCEVTTEAASYYGRFLKYLSHNFGMSFHSCSHIFIPIFNILTFDIQHYLAIHQILIPFWWRAALL